jgi:hypothetical protein
VNVPTLNCRVCGESPPLKSNAGIVEECARFLRDLEVRPNASCPDPTCANHGVPVGAEAGHYQGFGLTRSGSQRYRCKACGKTFAVGKSTTGHKQPHKNKMIFALLVNKSPFRRIKKRRTLCMQRQGAKWSFERGDEFNASRGCTLPRSRAQRSMPGAHQADTAAAWGQAHASPSISRALPHELELLAFRPAALFGHFCFGTRLRTLIPKIFDSPRSNHQIGGLPCPIDR